ncbi:hypothetical protein [Pseudokineococcus sp. 1T1Z-3]|uniref:hypothetical protein n=1 Tax=Pseudokineococcus sp. 1T1Z-3 TaxID=3132745 RepID=UPI0030AC4B3C
MSTPTEPTVTAPQVAQTMASAIADGSTVADVMHAGNAVLSDWWTNEAHPIARAYIDAETGLSARSRTFAGKASSIVVEQATGQLLGAGLLSAVLATRLAELTGDTVVDVLNDTLERADHL